MRQAVLLKSACQGSPYHRWISRSIAQFGAFTSCICSLWLLPDEYIPKKACGKCELRRCITNGRSYGSTFITADGVCYQTKDCSFGRSFRVQPKGTAPTTSIPQSALLEIFVSPKSSISHSCSARHGRSSRETHHLRWLDCYVV